MANADGSIIIKTKVDVDQAEKNLAKLKGSIEKTEKEIEEMEGKREQAERQSVFSAAELDAEKAKLQEMKRDLQEMKDIAKDITLSPSTRNEAKSRIPMQRDAIADQRARVSMLQAEYNKLDSSVSRYADKIETARKKLDEQTSEAGQLARKINSVSKSSLKMAEAQEKAAKKAQVFGKRLAAVIRSALIFTVVTRALSGVREWVSGLIITNEEARESIARLKAALLTMAQPLVSVVVPAFTKVVDVLTHMVVVLGNLFASLAGTTYEGSKDAANALNKEQEAIKGVGDAAKKASGQLAAFDEINKLGEDGKLSDYIAPDFSGLETVKIPEWLTSLTATMSDIYFKWDNLTADDIVKKVVASLVDVAGAVIGFSVGGIKGALIGLTIGASLSSWLTDLSFDDNGKLDTEEIVSSLCTAMTAVSGAVIGFSAGGIKGAAVGLSVGASAGVAISHLLFDGNGQMDTEELLSSLCLALGAVVGAVIGFKVGGPKGAAIGLSVGMGAAALVSTMTFNGDGKMAAEEVLGLLCSALFAVVGGVVGFKVGGPKGAAIGATIGAGVGTMIKSLVFDNDGVLSGEEIAKSITSALGAIVGGVIGFTVGGPGGAFIGVTVGAAATAMLSNVVFDGDGKLNSKELLTSLCSAAGAIVGAVIGFAVGGPMGAAIGLTVGAVLTVAITDVIFEGFNDLKENVPNFKGIGPDYSWMFDGKSGNTGGLTLPSSKVAQGSVIPKNTSFMQDYSSLMEKFFPSTGFGNVSGAASSGGDIHVELVLDGKKLAANQVKHINDMSKQAGRSVLFV